MQSVCRATAQLAQVIRKNRRKDCIVPEGRANMRLRKEVAIALNAPFGLIVDCRVCITVPNLLRAEFCLLIAQIMRRDFYACKNKMYIRTR